MTSASVWSYYRNKINDSAFKNNDDGNKINSNKTITSKPFKYKTKRKGKPPNDDNTLNAEVSFH